jgi:hypothetical protein
MKKRMLSLVMAMVFGLALQANAGLITFEFQGTITEVVRDAYGVAGAWGSVGDPFWGHLSYDPIWHNAVGGYIDNNNPYTEWYYYNAFHDSPQATIELSLSTPSQQQVARGDMGLTLVRTTNSPTYDSFVAGGEYGHGFVLGFWLQDNMGTAISSTALPVDLKLTDWSYSHYVDITGFPDGGYVRGNITSIASPVPEPTSMLLLGTGLIGLAGYGRKKLSK